MISRKFIKLLLVFTVITVVNTECFSGGNTLKIHAVKYGKSDFQKRFVFQGDKSGGTVPFSWMFYYVEYGDRKILIDTGFNDNRMVKMFGITDFKDPVAILKENGIDADKITDVIITHAHFDHIGNAHRFKNAKFIINKDELADLNKGKSMSEVKKFFSDNANVIQFDESYLLYDMFNIKKIGGHTKGSSVVFFKSGGTDYCFTGDEAYVAENVSKNLANGSSFNLNNNKKFLDMLNKSSYKLFIFHDAKYADKKERFIQVLP